MLVLKKNMASSEILLLNKLLLNKVFHLIIEKEVSEVGYGQITFNVELKDGMANIDTLNVVKNRRRNFDIKKHLVDNINPK